jgi:hypothetical protein
LEGWLCFFLITKEGYGVIEKLTTDSYLECLIKTMVFTATIFIELVCGFSMTDIKPFYITILLQAINNMYDAGCSIAKKKQVFQVNLLQGITFLLALIDLISAVCLSLIFLFPMRSL